jgi:hypothetical protein
MKEEREALIARLARANDTSRAEIARRQAELAADPLGFDLVKLADRRATGEESDLAYGDPIEREGEPSGSPPVRKSADAGLVYKTGPERVPEPAPQPAPTDSEWEGWERWMRGHLDIERDVIARALGELMHELRKEWREDFKDAIAKRDAAIARLEGKLDLTRLCAPSADVHELPKGFLRKVRDNG